MIMYILRIAHVNKTKNTTGVLRCKPATGVEFVCHFYHNKDAGNY